MQPADREVCVHNPNCLHCDCVNCAKASGVIVAEKHTTLIQNNCIEYRFIRTENRVNNVIPLKKSRKVSLYFPRIWLDCYETVEQVENCAPLTSGVNVRDTDGGTVGERKENRKVPFSGA